MRAQLQISPSVQAICVRPAIKADTDQMHAIEVASFASPWPREGIADEIESRSFTFSVVAEIDRVIIGFMIYWNVADEMHLINLAVAPAARRRGVGRVLMDHLLKEARRANACEILLEVRLSNQPARTLYESLGFEAVCIRIGYYADNDEDALVMSRRFPQDTGEIGNTGQ